PDGSRFDGCSGNSIVTTPAVDIRPIRLPVCSVNHIAPSGPAAMPYGPLFDLGSGYSVTTPSVVIRPIRLPMRSVNHRAPSGPAARPVGWLLAVGTGYSVTDPSR